MVASKINIIDKIKELISNLLKDKEIELVDISYKREGPTNVLRLTLDKKGGIRLDECSFINEQLGELLDKENFLNEAYTLEVCSPGLDRPLRTKKDFDRAKGKLVRINTYGPIEDKREHIGKVISCDEEFVTIELKDTNITRKIPLDKIANAVLELAF